MSDLLHHPAIQAAAAPFVAALVAALLLRPVKLAGLAIVSGFAAAILLIAGFDFMPLSTTRKIILVALLAPLVGIGLDVVIKSERNAAWIAALVAAAVTAWVFVVVLRQKEGALPWLLGSGIALCTAWLAGFMVSLRGDALRAGAAALGLGLGVGICAVLGASASFGQYGIALAAAAGAFILVTLVSGSAVVAGATMALTAAMLGGLLAGGTLLLASLPWAALVALCLVPLAVRLPVPDRAPQWIKAALLSVYALGPAALACGLAWQATSATPS